MLVLVWSAFWVPLSDHANYLAKRCYQSCIQGYEQGILWWLYLLKICTKSMNITQSLTPAEDFTLYYFVANTQELIIFTFVVINFHFLHLIIMFPCALCSLYSLQLVWPASPMAAVSFMVATNYILCQPQILLDINNRSCKSKYRIIDTPNIHVSRHLSVIWLGT